jgi:CubicO group peptidase (beta-lactamase class C family)
VLTDEFTPCAPATARDLGLMVGSPPPAERQVTLANWQEAPWNRWSFQHVGEIIPSARIPRGDGPVTALPVAELPVEDVDFETISGARITVRQLLERTYTDGFLVLKGGQVACERYYNGMAPATPHLLQSVSKSMTGALAGSLVGLGLLEPERAAEAYVPELETTSFAGASVRQVLDMSTGTRFTEEYDDPESDVRRYEAAAGWRPASAGDDLDLFRYMLTLGNHRPHGGVFEYRSILTDLLGCVIERAGGARFADLMSEHIWSRLGAEQDAHITVDRHGNPMADGGMSVTLRDLGRFGIMYLRRGRWNAKQIVPAAWVNDTLCADDACREAFARSVSAERYPRGHYRNQWWVPDGAAGILLAAGIYGQYVYIDARADVTIVKLSTLPFALDLGVSADHTRAFAAIAAALRQPLPDDRR